MRLIFDIDIKKEETNLHLDFDYNETDTGREGMLLAFEWLAFHLSDNPEEDKLVGDVCNFVGDSLRK